MCHPEAGGNWILTAVDPPKPDPWVGESQLCRAACFSQKGVATPVAPPTSGAFRYLGCFKDTGTRDLSGYFTSSGSMTTQMCVNVCREKGFSYASTQFSQQCFCGNSYGRYGAATNCNMPCNGNKSETCGGSWVNSVYSIK